ncbi:MAG: hypothetical protein ACFFD2_02380 [Promethearchaeota archaeon]
MIEYEINKYKIHIYSRQPPERESPTLAVITLWFDEKLCGYIHFYPDRTRLPNPVYENEIIRLRFHFTSYFHTIVDILRSEKPLYIDYSEPPPVAILRSGKEPIGEEERIFHPKE